MDGNKDEALNCLRIGKHALQSGDRGRALKFLSKSCRLDPALPIDDLLSVTREAGVGSGTGSSTPPPANSESSSSASASAKIASEGSSLSRTYTKEQVAVVRKIKTQQDYYEILGLERSCTIEDICKAYRKLSLKVHPDKNQAPGADEPFKAVLRAFQGLSNEENRKRYDMVGSEEPDYGRPTARTRHGKGFNGFYEGDVDAEEIFRNFLFGLEKSAS